MDQLVALAYIVGFTAYGWPGFRTPVQRVALVALVVLVPIVGWFYVVRRGHRARTGAAIARAAMARADAKRERLEAISFQQGMLVLGSPVERENARALLALWGADPDGKPRGLIEPESASLPVFTSHEPDYRYLLRFQSDPWLDLVCALPSGRVLVRAERDQLRRNGVLYIPTTLLPRRH